MQIVQPGQLFGFNYTAFDQSSSLKVAFNIYDASAAGAPIFLTKVVGSYAGFGSYAGTYLAEAGIRYAVIGVVYTDNTCSVVDTTRAPYSDVFRSDADTITDLGFLYASYNFASSLSIRAQIYNTSTGSPVFQEFSNLNYIDFGIYFGSFAGSISENFQIVCVVYTDNTFTTPDVNYAPSSVSFTIIGATPSAPVSNNNLVDVSELMHDTDFVDGISLITRIPTVNSLGENVISESTINSVGSVQPADGKTLARLPEALRLEDVSSFWFQGVIVASAPGQYPSILVFKNRRYQVKNVMDWSSWGRGWTQGICVAELPS